jgi:hypothetical protein
MITSEVFAKLFCAMYSVFFSISTRYQQTFYGIGGFFPSEYDGRK